MHESPYGLLLRGRCLPAPRRATSLLRCRQAVGKAQLVVQYWLGRVHLDINNVHIVLYFSGLFQY